MTMVDVTGSNMDVDEVEIRCPNGPGKLLAILRQSGDKPKITEGNLLEFACPDCPRLHRKSGRSMYRVLHRYNFIGELVETVEITQSE